MTSSACLAELIDEGYSKCFAFQINHTYLMDEGDFVLFDEQDRDIWGDTPMSHVDEVMKTQGGSEPGYASEWMTPTRTTGDRERFAQVRYRLICVSAIDPEKAADRETA